MSDSAYLTCFPVPYYPRLAFVVGGVNAAVMLSVLIQWQGRELPPTDWVRASVGQIMEGTGLTRDEYAGARRNLISRGLVTFHYRRLQHEMYYRVETDAVAKAVREMGARAEAGTL